MVENKRIVIVGAGHNGLVAAGYLAGAGLEVQVLERRDVVGGAAVTEEWFPGYRISTCSYICHILQKKVIDDLELRRYGFYVYPMDPARIYPFPTATSSGSGTTTRSPPPRYARFRPTTPTRGRSGRTSGTARSAYSATTT